MTALTAESINAAVQAGEPAEFCRLFATCSDWRRQGVHDGNAAYLALVAAIGQGWHVSDTKTGIRLTPPGAECPRNTTTGTS